ncbi:ThuA domain-containing protein [Candidatus Latescibacterota bacterium]
MFSGGTTRRQAMKAGIASLASATIITPENTQAAIKPKAPGETKVVYLGGDQLHNGMGQRQELQSVFSGTGWRLLFTTDARHLTPELLIDTDLLMITRWGGGIEGWCSEPIQEGRMDSDDYMSAELEEAIVDNVMNRGMGFMSFHCTCWTPDNKKFNTMMGIEGIMHGPVQTVHIHNINQNHPITQGIEEFDLPLDENFGVKLINKRAVKLYETTGREDNRRDIGGWCLENGNGRIVGIVAGHTYTAWRNENFRKMYWRGAHWALKRDIPPYDG